ncbi:lactate utilization protein C [Solibacillus sp. MA9]|uniref:Lactate utilization protein C n=1 Tax=Solibacillus palustris TaxID=2908203 RepID=A0ABS9UCU1_9BACL|nr:lactate utilization protein C [Solibacillus sp. MA9]MCH7322162.1 lactate utilization protein C [Solibacillus sp. MA9]
MIKQREAFLENIAHQLKRPMRTAVKRPKWKFQPQHDMFKNASSEELVEVLKEQCKNIHTTCLVTNTAELPNVLQSVVEANGGRSIITPKDERFAAFGLTETMTVWASQNIAHYEWNEEQPEENIRQAEQANISITISETTLAESGTAVLYSNKHNGRTMNFLPENVIVLIPKSTIVPRITQAAQLIHQQIEQGERISSCILMMTGPSNSADIEMVLIVGVHGPVKATYIIIEDK